MRPWTSAIGIVGSSLNRSLAPDCPNETFDIPDSVSRRRQIVAWCIAFLQLLPRFVDDDARYWPALLFLFRCIYAMCRGIHGKAVHHLLHRKVFELPKVFGIVFLHD